MDESRAVEEIALKVADSIARRDVDALARLLAPGFCHRTPGRTSSDASTFLEGIRQIPGEIVFVRLANVTIDVSVDNALMTGIQHAQVRIDGALVDDRRAFVDWFVKHEGEWRIRVAADFSITQEPSSPTG
jgi:ketosteroid isomerase-like protein